MLGTCYGDVGTRFSLILGTRSGSLKHLKKTLIILSLICILKRKL